MIAITFSFPKLLVLDLEGDVIELHDYRNLTRRLPLMMPSDMRYIAAERETFGHYAITNLLTQRCQYDQSALMAQILFAAEVSKLAFYRLRSSQAEPKPSVTVL